jgi:exopolyphosphatase/guanosine-5'-triphosphate,3'-diphosphate pyrophosphatase
MSPAVAIVDIGSNTIKVLVAARDDAGQLAVLNSHTIDARISAGISHDEPVLSEEGMARGVAAIQELLADTAKFSTARAQLVATSAVRDARNGGDFADRVRRATGFDIRILSGDEEANAIGRGLTCDPALVGLQNFYVFDLGGGSLECLSFAERKIQEAISLQLGCVRLTEKYIADPSTPFSPEARKRIQAHTRLAIAECAFRFDLPFPAAVATGGTAATVRIIQGARTGRQIGETSPLITVQLLRELLDELAPLTLEQRKLIPGMPAARADIFPTALATLLAVAETGGLTAFHHSFYNLRYGLAADLLGEV